MDRQEENIKKENAKIFVDNLLTKKDTGPRIENISNLLYKDFSQ